MDYPEPGIELDRLVAEKVLGWFQASSHAGPRQCWRKEGEEYPKYLVHFSTDIKAAWDLVEKLRLSVGLYNGGWTAFREGRFHQDGKANFAIDAPHAICLAALNITKAEATACVITYQDNVLHCGRYPTRKENYETVKAALIILLGMALEDEDFEAGGGTVEIYRSVG